MSEQLLKDTRAMTSAFRFFYHRDHMNAELHLGAVRYSPITFQLAEALSYEGHNQDMMYDGDQTYVKVNEVMEHKGAYAEDRGR